MLDPDKTYSRIFLIGTSHHIHLNGASVYNKGDYATPLGTVEVDIELTDKLIKENRFFEFTPGAHNKEHSLEVQLPFLQYRLKSKFRIVPIIIGTQSAGTINKIADALKPYFTEENLFVISTDFSHYPGYSGAMLADKTTGDAIASNSPAAFLEAIQKNTSRKIPGLVTSCCAWSSVLTLLNITSEIPGIKVRHVKYANSGDSPYGDQEQVVGYHSFIFSREEPNFESGKGFSLSSEEKKQLLEVARQAIDSYLIHRGIPFVPPEQFSANLQTPCGAFVTLNKNGRLRGCIGRFMATEPLYKVVQEMAVAAAFQDNRFQPVGKGEMKDIEVEISVLTPLIKIQGIDEFELGKHGIYIKKGSRSGTYLPQVAHETGWGKEEFLGHCARDKAGIGWDGWKDADLYTYEALVFNEQEIMHPTHE